MLLLQRGKRGRSNQEWLQFEYTSNNVFGYSVLARPLSKRFWTLSGWKDEAALSAFVQYPPHVRIITVLAPHVGDTKFVRWTVKGAQLPLSWEDALRR